MKLGVRSVTLTPKPALNMIVGNADPGDVDGGTGRDSVLLLGIKLICVVDS